MTRGRGLLLRDGPGGHEILLRVLGPGQIVSNEGTLMLAETTLELLALPAPAARLGGQYTRPRWRLMSKRAVLATAMTVMTPA